MSRSYLSELQNITLRLNEAEQRLMRGIQTPPPSRLSADSADNTVQIAEQEVSVSAICWLQQAITPLNEMNIEFYQLYEMLVFYIYGIELVIFGFAVQFSCSITF